MDWLKTLGEVLWDFDHLLMRFTKDGREVSITGINSKPIKVIEAQRMERLLKVAKPLGVVVTPLSTQSVFRLEGQVMLVQKGQVMLGQEGSEPAINNLIQRFNKLFDEPTWLPPLREHNHRIPTVPGSSPVNMRLYRYAHFQKVEIECLVQEMLKAGTIRASNSPFSSLALLVRKKDGSWHLCVDYWALNNITIKDKYPIPIIDELLDELYGEAVFSKLDLRTGYHQVRVDDADIHKTAFRTHDGHFEFLVMSFGLTNASGSSIICETLQMLLWCKPGGLFGSRYHVEGVAVDPMKIQSMLDWPTPSFLTALRGFLGLSGYYRKFVKDYGKISTPLTELLKKGKVFVIETDTSGLGLGAVLTQTHRETLILDTPANHHHLGPHLGDNTKLLGYDFEIVYQRGADNTVADALSCREKLEGSLCPVSRIEPTWLEQLKADLAGDPWGLVVLSPTSPWRQKLLFERHDSPQAGHEGYRKTWQKYETLNAPGLLGPVSELFINLYPIHCYLGRIIPNNLCLSSSSSSSEAMAAEDGKIIVDKFTDMDLGFWKTQIEEIVQPLLRKKPKTMKDD
ncbi:uncharacterized protein LOC119992723 [Tripterygium wilfordii]|uniref:uncharacterized protein LOC119992723 n=1 Tax=Tripterygium wilfordii TaxID=458696 RepID=UPI0018F81F9F|nr:uncharacterized protein LOC119992723 [Tripterygium wilfordii]